jgi:hypothetical protein
MLHWFMIHALHELVAGILHRVFEATFIWVVLVCAERFIEDCLL